MSQRSHAVRRQIAMAEGYCCTVNSQRQAAGRRPECGEGPAGNIRRRGRPTQPPQHYEQSMIDKSCDCTSKQPTLARSAPSTSFSGWWFVSFQLLYASSRTLTKIRKSRHVPQHSRCTRTTPGIRTTSATKGCHACCASPSASLLATLHRHSLATVS